MRLSTRARYGLRAAVDLAEAYGGRPVSMASIAERHEISRKYLHAILSALRAAGFVRSVRGTRGGYALARPPAAVRVRDLLEVLEGSLAPADCVGNARACGRAKDCVTRLVWQDLHRAVEMVLSEVTLRDLVERKKRANGADPAFGI